MQSPEDTFSFRNKGLTVGVSGLWGSALLQGGLSISVMGASTLELEVWSPQQSFRSQSPEWGPSRWAGARFLLGKTE